MTTTIDPARAGIHVPASRHVAGFHRIAGFAGLVAIAVGVTQALIVGSTPGLGDSASEVAAFYATNLDAHRVGVVATALLGIPLAVFMVGVHRTLAIADRTRDTSWATVFLYGAIMMSVTAGLTEGLFAILALRGGAGLDPNTVRALNDGAQIAGATLGVWIAVAIGSVAAATFLNRIRPTWYGWLCGIAAVLGALAVVDTVSTSTGGAFAQLAFFFGVIVWVTATSILLLRDRS
jgi:hypothetical protein